MGVSYGSITDIETYADTLWDFLHQVEKNSGLPRGWAEATYKAYVEKALQVSETIGFALDDLPLFDELNDATGLERQTYTNQYTRILDYQKEQLGEFYNNYYNYLSKNPTDFAGAEANAKNMKVQWENAQYPTQLENYKFRQEIQENARMARAYGGVQNQFAQAEAEWMGEIPSEYQALQGEIAKQGLTAPMMEYFSPSRVYELGSEGYNEQARLDWWKAVGGFTDLPQRYEQYKLDVTGKFSQIAKGAGWGGADLPPDYFLSTAGRKQFEDMKKSMEAAGVNINQTLALYGATGADVSDANVISPWDKWLAAQQRMAFPEYGGEPTAEELAADPLKKLAQKFPYLQTWLGLTPSQRGVRLPTTRSVWRT